MSKKMLAFLLAITLMGSLIPGIGVFAADNVGQVLEAENATLISAVGAANTVAAYDNALASGGKAVGFLDEAGDAVEWTVHVTTSGVYELEIGYNKWFGFYGTHNLYVNGVLQPKVMYDLTVENQGSYVLGFEKANAYAALSAGANTIKLEVVASNTVIAQNWQELDYLKVTRKINNSFNKYEAENAQLIEAAPGSGAPVTAYPDPTASNGYVVGSLDHVNDAVNFTNVTVPETGIYKIQFVYATGGDGADYKVYTNGSSTYNSLLIHTTGGWWDYTSTYMYLPLNKGINNIYFAVYAGAIDIDYINVLQMLTPEGATYEAEAATYNGNLNSNSWSTASGGLCVEVVPGNSITFNNVNVATEGDYDIEIRYSKLIDRNSWWNGDRSVNNIYVNGTYQTNAYFYDTQDWIFMSSAFIKVHLLAGTNTVLFNWGTAFTMIDCIRVYKPYTVAFGNYNLSSNYVSNISPATTVNNFMDGLVLSNGSTVTSALGNDSFVGTGTEFIVSKGGQNTSYKALIYGDVNGDGAITISDLLSVKKHLLNLSTLSGDFLTAGKITKQTNITINDLAAIKSHLLKISAIPQA